MIEVQAAPNTQPGGVQGALFSSAYQSEETPEAVNTLPTPSAAKLSTPKTMIGRIIYFAVKAFVRLFNEFCLLKMPTY